MATCLTTRAAMVSSVIALTLSCATQQVAHATSTRSLNPVTLPHPTYEAASHPRPRPFPHPAHRPTSHLRLPAHARPHPPVLAFYYMWYTRATWSLRDMSALPTAPYVSSSPATISRQVHEAASAGITGFISSWWGSGSATDHNFRKLQAQATLLRRQTHYHFTSTIYFESDSPQMTGESSLVANLRYVLARYSHGSNFFHWHGKPVIFIWDPLGNGRTLAEWADIRQQVDPYHRTVWSAEGVSMSLLDVFDGIHLFSAGYWGLQDGNMPAVDRGFRAKVNAYNRAHHTHRIWAAGVEPGYNDTRVPGRAYTYIVPRDDGATYRTSWSAALISHPDWITITSFNEWFEGAMIEPGAGYGNLYLRLTHQFARES